jgi:type II secretory pathway component PulF
MPLILTPRQLIHRAEFYQQLAAMVAAGVSLIPAIEMVRDSPPAPGLRRPLGRLVEELNQGATFTDAASTLGTAWLPSFDLALLKAGEQSGRLDACFKFLSEYYRQRATLARQVLADLAYPAFVLHIAVLIFPIGLLTDLVWHGKALPFLMAKIAILAPCYAAIVLLLYLVQPGHGEHWRTWVERTLRAVPVLGAALANLALARLTVALESLLNAGVSIIDAWELAAIASGSPTLRRAVIAWRPDVLGGQTPSEAVRASHAFPDLFTSLYNTGEISGQLDDTLRRLARHYQEEATRKLHAFAQWLPRLIYFGVVLFIGYQVISFWAGYFNQIGQLSQ